MFDASGIVSDVVGIALAKLERLEIFSTMLEKKHLQEFFKTILSSGTNLKVIHFCMVDLSEIDFTRLPKSVHKIQVVKLCKAQLSPMQLKSIVQQTNNESQMQILDLRNNKNMWYVDQQLKQKATMALERFEYDTFKLKHFQSVSYKIILYSYGIGLYVCLFLCGCYLLHLYICEK